MVTTTENPAGTPRLEDLDVIGGKPFTHPRSSVTDRLEEAHALLTVLATGESDAHGDTASSLASLSGWTKQRAYEGVATLIALALHHDAVATELGAR